MIESDRQIEFPVQPPQNGEARPASPAAEEFDSPEYRDALALQEVGQTPLLPPREPLGKRLASMIGRHHALLFTLCFLLLWLVTALPLVGPGDNLKLGSAAPRDIIAPHEGMLLDREETKRRQQDAISLVPPVYTPQPHAQELALAELRHVLGEARRTVADKTELGDEAGANLVAPQPAATAGAGDISGSTAGERAVIFNRSLDKPWPLTLVSALLSLPVDQLGQVQHAAEKAVRAVYQGGQYRSDVPEDEAIAAQRIDKTLSANRDALKLTDGELKLAGAVAREVCSKQPNVLVNDKASEAARQVAISEINPVYQRVGAGTVLVKANEIVTDEKWAQLQDMGLVTRFDVRAALAKLAICLVLVGLAAAYMVGFNKRLAARPAGLWLAAMMPVVFTFVFRLLLPVPHADFAMVPLAATAAMLLTVLLDASVGIFAGFMIAALCAVMAHSEVNMFLAASLSASVGALSVSEINSRGQLVRAAALLATTNALLAAAMEAMRPANADELLSTIVWGASAGIFSVLAMAGLAMFLERPFGITTHLRLLELMAPDELVMRRMQAEAPGTYTHSLMVAMLAESAAKNVGADALVCRVGGLYHDIGKLHRPHCFVENQNGDNIHDRLTPQLSARIIMAHVEDGLELARALRLPQPIMEIIAQHHGTSLIAYFYYRAVQRARAATMGQEAIGEATAGADQSDVGATSILAIGEPAVNVDQALFRYAGPRPQSKEAAIVLLADTVEASARALVNPTLERLEAHIKTMVGERLHDGELSDCDLTLRDLGIIESSFTHVLRGVLHQRIVYPSAENELSPAEATGNNWMSTALADPFAAPAKARGQATAAVAKTTSEGVAARRHQIRFRNGKSNGALKPTGRRLKSRGDLENAAKSPISGADATPPTRIKNENTGPNNVEQSGANVAADTSSGSQRTSHAAVGTGSGSESVERNGTSGGDNNGSAHPMPVAGQLPRRLG